MMIAALLLQAAVPVAAGPPPSAEAVEWGRRVAEGGTFARLAPMIAAEDTDALLRDTPGLTEADKAELRATAKATLATGLARIAATMGDAYARNMSVDEMKAVVAFNATPAAQRYRAAEPAAIMAAASGASGMDFKGDTLKAFCAKTGKACPTKR